MTTAEISRQAALKDLLADPTYGPIANAAQRWVNHTVISEEAGARNPWGAQCKREGEKADAARKDFYDRLLALQAKTDKPAVTLVEARAAAVRMREQGQLGQEALWTIQAFLTELDSMQP